jgi:hypothetical protein
VSEEGIILLLPLTSRKVLNVGVAILQSLAVDDFRAILAHEFAHFTRQDPFHYRLVSRVLQAFSQYEDYTRNLSGWSQVVPGAGCGALFLLPVTLCLRGFIRFFISIATSFAREGELAADRTAALSYGPDTLVRALKKYATETYLFERNRGKILSLLVRMNLEPEELYQRYRSFRSQVTDDKVEQIWEAAKQKQPPHSSMYPSISERLEHITDISLGSSEDLAGDLQSDGLNICTTNGEQRYVREMIENADEIEKRLSRTLVAFAKNREVQARPQPYRTRSPLVRTLTTGLVRWVVASAILIIPLGLICVLPSTDSLSRDERFIPFVSIVTVFFTLLFLTTTHKGR